MGRQIKLNIVVKVLVKIYVSSCIIMFTYKYEGEKE